MNEKAQPSILKEVPVLGSKRKRERPVVEVVTCPSPFPISQRQQRPPPTTAAEPKEVQQQRPAPEELLDWRETAREVRSLGAAAFEGEQKRNFKDEQYRWLTGRSPKKQRVPLPIVRGIRRKAAERDRRQREEARQAGIVLPKPPKKAEKVDRTSQVYGPAPSIGRLQKGMLKVKGKPPHKKK